MEHRDKRQRVHSVDYVGIVVNDVNMVALILEQLLYRDTRCRRVFKVSKVWRDAWYQALHRARAGPLARAVWQTHTCFKARQYYAKYKYHSICGYCAKLHFDTLVKIERTVPVFYAEHRGRDLLLTEES